jgi:RNA polymerase sigma factor (sigma-70 family)
VAAVPIVTKSSPEELEALAAAAQEGREGAVECLLSTLAPSMHGVIRSVLGNRSQPGADTEDLLQDALVELLGSLPTFRHEAGIRHYACRIALFVALKARRRGTLGGEKLQQLKHSALPLGGIRPRQHLDEGATERREAWLVLLDRLPENQARTLALRVVLGYGIPEVAEQTGVPINTVRSRLRLAKEALRKAIENDPALRELFAPEQA